MEKKLNSKQWRLYNFIKFITEQGRWTDKKEICTELNDLYSLQTTKNETSEINNCPAIYQDIKAINNSDEIEKIIIVDSNKIYLGSEQQCYDYAEKLKAKAIKLLKRSWTIHSKAISDGQGKIISCQGNVITEESKARDFVEAFVKEINV